MTNYSAEAAISEPLSKAYQRGIRWAVVVTTKTGHRYTGGVSYLGGDHVVLYSAGDRSSTVVLLSEIEAVSSEL